MFSKYWISDAFPGLFCLDGKPPSLKMMDVFSRYLLHRLVSATLLSATYSNNGRMICLTAISVFNWCLVFSTQLACWSRHFRFSSKGRKDWNSVEFFTFPSRKFWTFILAHSWSLNECIMFHQYTDVWLPMVWRVVAVNICLRRMFPFVSWGNRTENINKYWSLSCWDYFWKYCFLITIQVFNCGWWFLFFKNLSCEVEMLSLDSLIEQWQFLGQKHSFFSKPYVCLLIQFMIPTI